MAATAPASIPRFHAAVAVVMVVALVGIGRLWAAPPEHPSPGVFALTFPTGKDFCNLYTIGRMWAERVPLAEAYDSTRYARFQRGGRSWFVPLAWLLPVLTVLGNYARVPFAPLVLLGFALAVGRAAAHGSRASVWTRSA